MSRIVITGNGAICGAGTDPGSIVEALLAGRSAIAPITKQVVAKAFTRGRFKKTCRNNLIRINILIRNGYCC